eukprot:6186663-Pleurochrysis_carterae.AAC.1
MACPTIDMMVAARRVCATCLTTGRWASGHVFMYGKAAITWSSKKQPTVALSSCEAEIIAVSEAAKKSTYLRALLRELGEPNDDATKLHLDNQSAINLAYNAEHNSRSKHIHRRHFFIREKVEELELAVPFVRSADNLAYFFTKPLSPRLFFPLRDVIMNVARSRGVLKSQRSALRLPFKRLDIN